jgi:hypothetical protein
MTMTRTVVNQSNTGENKERNNTMTLSSMRTQWRKVSKQRLVVNPQIRYCNSPSKYVIPFVTEDGVNEQKPRAKRQKKSDVLAKTAGTPLDEQAGAKKHPARVVTDARKPTTASSVPSPPITQPPSPLDECEPAAKLVAIKQEEDTNKFKCDGEDLFESNSY